MLDADNVLKLQQLEREGVPGSLRDRSGDPETSQREATPRSKQVHSLLLESIEQIAGSWMAQLDMLQKSAEEMKQQILTYMGRTKSDIDALHELGIKVAAEAARGQAVCKELRDGLEKIS